MNKTQRHAKNLERFRQAVNSHDRENPDHNAHGIGLSWFDMERLGYDEGETLWAGITIHGLDKQQTGNLRVLCDGEHDGDKAETEEKEDLFVGASHNRNVIHPSRSVESGSWKGAEEWGPRPWG